MKITWNWLADYVDLSGLTPERVAEDLTAAGIPVETVTPLNHGVSGVVVGRIEAIMAHSQAKRLRICTVDIGKKKASIVTAATNVQEGDVVPVAKVGAKLPEKTIELADFRGVASEGMLCSATELGLDDRFLPKEQAEGIWVLPSDAPIGEDVVTYLGLDDVMLELELTPNRGDCLSLRGVAYEVGAIYSRPVHMPDDQPVIAPDESLPLRVQIKTDRCSAYTAQVVAGLTLGPAPMWMQMRLLAVGMRPISNLVDITNYVMFEWGQPLHAFDYDAIAENGIIVRQADAGEELRTLDSQDRELTEDVIVIADSQKGLGLAGVMGGENSEVTASTRAVVIESALFDPITTRRTSQQLQLRSEASLRFEKGPDREAVLPALRRATALMVKYAGGRVIGEPVVTGADVVNPPELPSIRVRVKRVQDVLGYRLEEAELTAICERLGLAVKRDPESLLVTVPPRRPDLVREEDMMEEFARLAGYDRIPSTTLEGVLSHGGLQPTQRLRRIAKDYLRNQGFDEVWTYSFVSGDSHRLLNLEDDHELAQATRLLNPLSEERVALRTNMLSPLLDVARYNASRQVDALFVFELGAVFVPPSADGGAVQPPLEKKVLAGLAYGAAGSEPLYARRRYDFFDLKGLLEGLFGRLGIASALTYERSLAPYFHYGRAASVRLNGDLVGEMGQLRKSVTNAFDLSSDVYYFQLDFDHLFESVAQRLYVVELPRFPQVERDLAVVVKRTVPVADLLTSVRAAVGDLLVSVSVFDVYTGDHVGDDEKSVALRMVFRAYDRTLTEGEAQSAVDQALARLGVDYGAAIRR